jgi:hypothetical protein
VNREEAYLIATHPKGASNLGNPKKEKLQMGRPVSESEQRKIAAQMIASDLERLRRQAEANGLVLLAYLLELAQAEAIEMEN